MFKARCHTYNTGITNHCDWKSEMFKARCHTYGTGITNHYDWKSERTDKRLMGIHAVTTTLP